jgi:diguanylate cyclase (GGDEF)-like protein
MAALTGVGVVEMLGERAPVGSGSAYFVSASVLVAGIVASGQVRLTTAIIACLACALATPLVMLAFPGTLPAQRFPGMLFVAIVGGLIVCLAVRRNEILRRSEYLHELRYRIRADELLLLNDELTRLSTTDLLTGLANRRHFLDQARHVWDDPSQAPFALALADVDDFKAFNDAAGHSAGDRCLEAVAGALKGALRQDEDRAARYGGEEFVILFPGAWGEALPELGERLRSAVEALQIPHPALPGRFVTVSVGIAGQAGRAGSLEGLLGEADSLMYLAKHSGRNRVCVATRSHAADAIA